MANSKDTAPELAIPMPIQWTLTHFLNIMRICEATRDVLFWIPTREVALVRANADGCPLNG